MCMFRIGEDVAKVKSGNNQCVEALRVSGIKAENEWQNI